MGKRFTDSNKWEDPWYMNLSLDEKLVYEYILDKSSNIGIWKPNPRLATFCIGIDSEFDFELFSVKMGTDRVRVLTNGDWWLLKYIEYQYGELSEDSKSPPIKSYIRLLKKHRLWLDYLKSTVSHKEKDKDKEKNKDKKEDKDALQIVREENDQTERDLTDVQGFDWQKGETI